MEMEGQVHRLHIHDVTVDDAGIYKAVLGEAQSIMALRIKGKISGASCGCCEGCVDQPGFLNSTLFSGGQAPKDINVLTSAPIASLFSWPLLSFSLTATPRILKETFAAGEGAAEGGVEQRGSTGKR